MENHQEITYFKVSDWVVVQYDNQNYPGEISDVMDEEIVVSAIHPASGKRFKWVNHKDECIYPFLAVIAKIHPIEVAGGRGQFSFDYFN